MGLLWLREPEFKAEELLRMEEEEEEEANAVSSESIVTEEGAQVCVLLNPGFGRHMERGALETHFRILTKRQPNPAGEKTTSEQRDFYL